MKSTSWASWQPYLNGHEALVFKARRWEAKVNEHSKRGARKPRYSTTVLITVKHPVRYGKAVYATKEDAITR